MKIYQLKFKREMNELLIFDRTREGPKESGEQLGHHVSHGPTT